MRRTKWIRLGLTAACAALRPWPGLAQPSAQTASAANAATGPVERNPNAHRRDGPGARSCFCFTDGRSPGTRGGISSRPSPPRASMRSRPTCAGTVRPTSRPPSADYDIHHLTADVVGLIDALGEKTAVVVGHDWGSIVAWNSVLLHPGRFTGLVAMSVPYGGPARRLAGRKLEEDVRRQLLLHPLLPGAWRRGGRVRQGPARHPEPAVSRRRTRRGNAPAITDRARAAGGWIPRLGAPKGLPSWLTQADLDYYVREFTAAGFRGGINYYRNFHRNWETTPQLAGAKIAQPVLFLAGERDNVIAGVGAERLTASIGQRGDRPARSDALSRRGPLGAAGTPRRNQCSGRPVPEHHSDDAVAHRKFEISNFKFQILVLDSPLRFYPLHHLRHVVRKQVAPGHQLLRLGLRERQILRSGGVAFLE